MKSYTLKQTRNQHGEVFDQAKVEPVLITEQKRPSYVILSAESYQKLIDKLEELEDLHWGQQAQTALTQSSMVGSEEFSTTLERFANG
ncbi:prevent-host-death family protein [Planktothrix agardhii CCAP 1459/11A]|jgi:PHD/YefM family antitoxin component YafN of YafNO toxin-antitoxin module|uniref:Antitoxin n=5 Tax=Planktothrix agardhii TaxID=1160 RepID=A0A1J1JLV8_PLAAG|nr:MULTISPECIES: type II toxin-antitoxin system Phd/YefM family antitoxin [Planktothrix]AQY60794.1 hypothetical protein [Planktothrix agardhii No365]AQY61170.1 hypothetical protein [Planktothrix agardhii NIVA-CYA 68]CAH2573936.1 Antitoxin [Planktothrix rubescens]MBG0746320.1 type II toxin-antitoxin system Phd/YefM family antitoxin [Planktothrix agardhii KL2]MCF3581886.1 type II toxin-antitoxin system Phd/YefM family antitoxin [Planktothrix agardhii 1811]